MDISAVFEAIRVLHDPRATASARQAAHQFCESLKSDDGSAFALAGQLIAPTLANEIRYFGFQLYEYLIAKKWARLPPQSQSELKGIVLQIIGSGTRNMLVEARFIKEKAVQLVGLIAQREWPTRWPELFPTLIHLTKSGETQCELALLALRSIAQGIFDDTSLLDARRNELLVALNSEYPGIYAFCYQILDRHFRSWTEATTAGNSNNPQALASKMLVTVSLQTFETYAPLSSLQAITDSGVLPALRLLLHEASFRDLAITVIVAVMSKKTKEMPHAPLIAFIQGVLESCGSGGLLQQTDHTFHKRLCTALTDFGCSFFSVLKDSALASARDTYLELMASFTGHNSVLISTITLPFWRTYLDQRDPISEQVHACLLRSISDKISKPVQSNFSDVGEEDIGDEFNDFEEFSRFWSQAKAKYLEIVKRLTAAKPAASLMFAGAQWQAALFVDTIADDAPTRARFDTLCSLLETVMTSLPEATLAAAPSAAPAEEAVRVQVVGACEMLTGMLLQVDTATADPLAAGHVTRALSLLGPYFRTHPQAAPVALRTMLMHYSTFAPAPGDPPARREQIANLRRRVSVAAVKVAQAAAAGLLPYRAQLQQLGQELMANKVVSVEETSHLYELFFVMSTPLASQEDWGRFISEMLVQPLAVWTSESMQAVMADYAAWLAPAINGTDPAAPVPVAGGGAGGGGGAVSTLGGGGVGAGAGGGGAGVGNGTTAGEQEMLQAREQLQGVLVTLLCIFRRCIGGNLLTDAFRLELSVHVRKILPPLATLIASIHAVWEPAVRAAVPPGGWSLVYKAVEFDRAVDPTYRTPFDAHSRANELAAWLRHARDECYQLAGMLSSFPEGFYGSLAEDPSLIERMMRHLPCMEDRHVRSLLRLLVGPMVRHCPPAAHARLLAPLLPPLLDHVLQRVQRGYAEMAARGQQNAPPAPAGGGSEKDEIVAEQAVRLLHREMIDLILTVVDPAHPINSPAAAPLAITAAASAARGDHHAAAAGLGDADGTAAAARPADAMRASAVAAAGEELAVFFLGTEAGAGILLAPVLYSLQWQDSTAAQKACAAVQKLLQRARAMPHLQALLVIHGLPAIAEGIRTATAAESDKESGLLNLLRDVYAALAPLCLGEMLQALGRITGAGPEAPQVVQEAMARNAGSKKNQRQQLLQLIKPGGRAAEAAGKEGAALPTLPDGALLALYRRRRTEEQSWTDVDASTAWTWLEGWS